MNGPALAVLRRGVCAIGWIDVTPEEFVREPQIDRLEIVGSGFLVGPIAVLTCDHVVEELLKKQRKSRGRPFALIAHFVYPVIADHAKWATVFRAFDVSQRIAAIDIAVLRLQGSPPDIEAPPIVAGHWVATVAEPIALCGYAHGSVLLRRGKLIDRFGPVVQAGIIAALSPFDTPNADSAILDLVTGPAASGSPIFRQSTGDIIGVLTAGQIRQAAALSFARLIYRAEDGRLAVRGDTNVVMRSSSFDVERADPDEGT
jgi:hypothetical protein